MFNDFTSRAGRRFSQTRSRGLPALWIPFFVAALGSLHCGQPSAVPGIRTADVQISANDGTLLEGYYALPGQAAPEEGWPVVLTLHGYSRGLNREIAESWARKGYLGVVYSARGNAGSQGYNSFGWREAFDVRDVITYTIENLPARSDRIGVVGGSFGGFRAYFAALVDKRIRTICPSAFPTYAPDAFVPNDVFVAFTYYYQKARDVVRPLGFKVGFEGGLSPAELRALTDLRSVQWFAGEIECPVFVHLGFLDVIAPANSTIRFWEELGVPKKMYLGSGGHGARGHPADQDRFSRLRDRWLAHWLKDLDTGLLEEPEVYYGLRPSWEPAAADSFPPQPAPDPRRYHLSMGGEGQDGILGGLPNSPGVIELVNRGLRPSPGPSTEARLKASQVQGVVPGDAHIFETPPLDQAFTLLGNPRIHLEVTALSPAWQVYAALFDVAPGGGAELVTMAPYGKPEAGSGSFQAEFELRSMAYRFAAGHRVRIELRNHGEPIFVPYFEEFRLEVTSTPARPSWIEIPIAAE